MSKNKKDSQREFYKLVDTPTTEDLLDFREFAVPVAERITSATKENTPLTVGIYGEWGNGKTSFLMMVEEELKKKSIFPIWFNAWKYEQEENLWVALIQTILDQTKVAGQWYRRAWIKITLWWDTIDIRAGGTELIKRLLSFSLRLVVFLLSVGLLLVWSTTEIEAFLNQALQGFFQNYALVYAFGIKIVLSIIGIIAAKPETLFQLFDTKLGIDFTKFSKRDSYREHIAFLDTFSTELQRIMWRANAGKPLVVIIDDLDRCLPEKAVQVLEAIKMFLDVKNCVFLLAADREIIEKVISLRYKDLISSQQSSDGKNIITPFASLSENYFEKIIQLPLSLPPLSREKIEQFVLTLYPSTEAELFAKIFSVGLPKNPRKIKRTLQIFAFLQSLANNKIKDGSIKNSLLAKLAIIQYRFRSLYSEIVETPEILHLLETYYGIPVDNVESQESFLESIDNASLRSKVKNYSLQYLPIKDVLLLMNDESDTFGAAHLKDYIYLINSIAEDRSTTSEFIQEQDSEAITRKYLQTFMNFYKPFILVNSVKHRID
jgi:Cdc6-like AAA superfamily ATPase